MRRAVAILMLSLAAVLVAGCEGGRTERAYPVLVPGGDPDRGRALVQRVHCGACHTIPDLRDADGLVGPPLTQFGRRTFIAGALPNRPEHLVRWLMDPHAVEPGTAMPDLGLTQPQARDVAAYLYTLQ